MQTQPVVAVLLSLYSCSGFLNRAVAPHRVAAFLMFLLVTALPVGAQDATLMQQSPRYLAHIELHTADELMAALLRADALYLSGEHQLGVDKPVAFVLHGPEARAFMLLNYESNRALVNLAAKLSALSVVDIKVCKTWMGSMSIDELQLLPFVGTVPYGPVEERRLINEKGFVYF